MPSPNSIIRKLLSLKMESTMLRRAKVADAIITTSGKISNGQHDGFEQYLKSKGLDCIVVENRPLEMSIPENKSSQQEQWTIGYLGRVREVKTFTLLLPPIELIAANKRPSLIIANYRISAHQLRQLMIEAVASGYI
mgnify:CR=1 FL=1